MGTVAEYVGKIVVTVSRIPGAKHVVAPSRKNNNRSRFPEWSYEEIQSYD